MWPATEHDARAVEKATRKRLETAVLIEIICTKDSDELENLSRTFENSKNSYFCFIIKGIYFIVD